MKREDVSKIFEGATDDQINAVLNINSADIGKAKGDYDTLKNQLSEAQREKAALETKGKTFYDISDTYSLGGPKEVLPLPKFCYRVTEVEKSNDGNIVIYG